MGLVCSTRFSRTASWAAFSKVRQLPLLLRKTTTVAVPSEAHLTRVRGMLKELMSEDSKEGRLSHTMRICAFTKEHSIKPWLVGGGMKDFYQVLSSDVQNNSVEGIIGLMKCLHPRDPFVESTAKTLSWRRDELDFHNCIYLVHLSVQSPRLVAILKPVYATLRGHLVQLMAEDADLSGPELVRAISLLSTVRHYSRRMSDKVVAYLARHLHRLDVQSVQSFLLQVAGGMKMHGIRCNPLFVDAVSTYFLEFLHRSTEMEDRAERWGESYGDCFSKFLRFYGDIKFYDETVCEKMKEIFLGPFDCNIHNPIFISSLVYMCGRVFYYDEDLLGYIMQLSYNQAESFHVNELKDSLLAFQSLNYNHQLFLDRVIEVALQSSNTIHSCGLYWSIISSSVFMNTYSPEVLQRFLTDSMLEGKAVNKESSLHEYIHVAQALFFLIKHAWARNRVHAPKKNAQLS